MKTTIELPDDLMMRVKLRAVQEHKKLKDAIAEYLDRGMKGSGTPAKTKSNGKHIEFPKVAKLVGRGPLTIDEIEAAINWGRE
jgi:hypothetical protein